MHPPIQHFLHLPVIVVDTLAAGGDLKAAEQQVKGQRVLRILRVIHGVEGALLGGVVGDKDKIRTVLLLEVAADVVLLLRLQVVGVADGAVIGLADQPLGLVEADGGDLIHPGQFHPQPLQVVGILRLQQVHHALEEGGLRLHQVGEGVDIAHLHVHGDILVQMAGGVVLLRPEHRGYLKHPLKDAHHHLLVELGGLGQKRLLAEVFHAEDVAAALGPGMDDLGGVDLGATLCEHLVPEGPAHGLLNFEHRALAQVAQRHGAQRQFSIQVQVHLVLVNGHRDRLLRTGEHFQCLQMELHPHGGPLVGGQRAGGDHRALLAHALQQPLVGFVHYALERAVPQTQSHKFDGTHGPDGVDCAMNTDRLIEERAPFEISGAQRFLLCSSHEFHLSHILCFKIVLILNLGKIKKVPDRIASIQSGTE